MLTSLRASFTQQRVIALGGALGTAGLASVWLVGAASYGVRQSAHATGVQLVHAVACIELCSLLLASSGPCFALLQQ